MTRFIDSNLMLPALFTLMVTSGLLVGCDTQDSNLVLGTLERERIAHTATTNEVITALPVNAGMIVTKGTLLVQFDDTLQQAQVNKAKAGVELAQANLEKLRHGARPEEVSAATAKVRGEKADLQELEAAYQREVNLSKDQLTSDANLNKALALRDKKRASLDALNKNLQQLTNGTRIEDLQMAEASLHSAQAVLASENKKLDNLSIKATRDGILDNLPWNLGERVIIGSPVAVILAGTAPFVRLYVPEPKRVNIHIGLELPVFVDGVPSAITGTVRWVSNPPALTPYYALHQTDRSGLMYLAQVQLPKEYAHLPNGVPAQVQLP
jgi:HlyD family secretion protein